MTGTRSAWDERIGVRTAGSGPDGTGLLEPPIGLTATAGAAQVTLDWEPADGAVGYQVYVADAPDGELRELDHAGRDVLAVPHPPYADTTGTPGRERWYAVAALWDVSAPGAPSARAAAAPGGGPAGPVTVGVDTSVQLGELARPWRPMIGSEHLSHALSTDATGGRVIGAELTAALRAARDELGVRAVRAHAILCDDVGVYREVDGQPVHDFTGVDRVYDHVTGLGLRPVVEVSFMPRDLAADPSATVFGYHAIVSPPKDWRRWHDLVRDLVAHLVERYGRDEVVRNWSFEVWNEANLEVFWSGTGQEYLRLYDVTAAAIRSVDERLVVGGPSSAAAEWVEELLAHAGRSGSPVDFVSTHTYGSPPLDLRPVLQRHGREGTPIWWTEWGVTPTHFNEVSDAVFSGVFLLRGMASAMDRIDALSYWVVSDHFEELGRPPELFHGGFGLRTVGELRKPRWWALYLLERLGRIRLPVALAGDGGGSLVEALAARADDGVVGVLVWNLTLDQSLSAGSDPLSRRVELTVDGLEPGRTYRLRHHRVDSGHSDIATVWDRVREPGQAWPTQKQWAVLAEADRLEEFAATSELTGDRHGRLSMSFELPMPAMSFVELSPR